jgi:hypothetical protein
VGGNAIGQVDVKDGYHGSEYTEYSRQQPCPLVDNGNLVDAKYLHVSIDDLLIDLFAICMLLCAAYASGYRRGRYACKKEQVIISTESVIYIKMGSYIGISFHLPVYDKLSSTGR